MKKEDNEDQQNDKLTIPEWLMTYGWAVLALLIVGALIYTQFFGGGA